MEYGIKTVLVQDDFFFLKGKGGEKCLFILQWISLLLTSKPIREGEIEKASDL